MSNVGRWNERYRNQTQPAPYRDTASYRIGAEFLRDCDVVEDWGCGLGWFSTFRTEGYVGIDGSETPFASKVVDLETYTSSVDGIFMRHVLEHNYRWHVILANAIQTFRKKMALVIFTPWSPDETREIAFVSQVGVPNLALGKRELLACLRGVAWELVELDSPTTMYGEEHILLLSKGAGTTEEGPPPGGPAAGAVNR